MAYQQNEKLIFQVNKRIKEDTELLLCFMESGPIQTSLNKNADEFQEAPSCSSVVPAPIGQRIHHFCLILLFVQMRKNILSKDFGFNSSDARVVTASASGAVDFNSILSRVKLTT